MIPTENRFSIALEKFLASNPELQINLDNLRPSIAENLGVSLEEYRKQKLAETFSEYAKENGLDTSKLIIDLCATNELERTEMHIQRHQKISKSLGMDFSEYCKLNQIEA
jgi:hypothetical protein